MGNTRMTLGQRIDALLKAIDKNQSDLAAYVGVTPQAVQQWIADETAPSRRHIGRVASFFGLTPEKLLYGENIIESVIVTNLSSDGYLRVEAMSPGMDGKEKPSQRIVRSIEIDQGEAVAMLGTRHLGNIKLLSATGDNMKPTINPKDLLFVDTGANQLSRDGVYVFVYAGGIEVRRLQRVSDGRVAIKSDNPAYETVYAQKQSELQILGMVTRSMSLQMHEFA